MTGIEFFAFVIAPVSLAGLGWAATLFYMRWLKTHPDG